MGEKQTLFVAFSGGRTSAYMCWWLLQNKSKEYNFVFVFCNTGQEHEKTLEFAHECDTRFGLNLVWLEAVINPVRNKGTTHKIVSFETASRSGEPFHEMIKVYGIPNMDWPHCSRELKTRVFDSYIRSHGFKTTHPRAIGIRVDEIDRMNISAVDKGEIIYPLISMAPTTKAEIRHWWARQSFDLEIAEQYGNCVTCWKKTDRKLMTIAKREPHRFEFFRSMERYSHVSPRPETRVFFRKNRSVDDIFALASRPFIEFKDHMPELQLALLDELDLPACNSESCEPYQDVG